MDDEAKLLADELHKRLCHWNHADQCGWFYMKEDEGWDSYTKKKYLDKAMAIINAGIDPDLAVQVLEIAG